MLNRLSEFEYISEENYTTRAVEYFKSILTSAVNHYKSAYDERQDILGKCNEILRYIMKLHNEVNMIYIC